MGICAPDDLNIPLEFSGEDKASSDKHQRPEGRESLHIANYIFKPNTAKTMTTFGNCPRGCRFCQYTNFDEYLFHMTADEVVSQFSKIVERFPDVHMFVIDDDDFLIRKSHCRDLVARLRNNPATLGKIFYVETTPIKSSLNIAGASLGWFSSHTVRCRKSSRTYRPARRQIKTVPILS